METSTNLALYTRNKIGTVRKTIKAGTMLKNRIEEIRVARKWSRQYLADTLGVCRSQLERLEKGQRKLDLEWLERLAKAFNCNPLDIIDPGVPLPTEQKFDKESLESIIVALKTMIISNKISLSPQDEAKAISIIYDYIHTKKTIENHIPINIGDVLHLVVNTITDK